MILAVNTTRMELLRLKRRIAIAKRGHKLLKDKQDELMRRFLSIIEETKSLRLRVENSLRDIFKDFVRARSINAPGFIDAQLIANKTSFDVAEKRERFLNLTLTRFEVLTLPQMPKYSFFGTTSDLDIALNNFRNLLPELIKLAELEAEIKLLSEEIKTTRRRVNVLEYIFIPNLIDTVKYITMKLAELERSSIVRLMRVKEVIEAR